MVLGIFMPAVMILSLLSAAENPDCSYDRTMMISLSQNEFDQDMVGGWRKLANAGCKREAADLIAAWIKANKSTSTTVHWHEGQMRASIGQNAAAIALFEKARKSESEDAGWGWNHYVDGSIAFLKGDKAALMASRNQLSLLPELESAKSMIDINGNPAKIDWPMNLDVLDRLISCWGKSYNEAYGCALPPNTNLPTQSKRAPEAP